MCNLYFLYFQDFQNKLEKIEKLKVEKLQIEKQYEQQIKQCKSENTELFSKLSIVTNELNDAKTTCIGLKSSLDNHILSCKYSDGKIKQIEERNQVLFVFIRQG